MAKRLFNTPIAVGDSTGSLTSIGANFPSNPTSGDVWIQTCPGGAVSPQLADGFESGDTSQWDNVTGSPVVARDYAYNGLYGARQSPANVTGSINWGTTRVAQNHAWCSFRHRWRVVQMPPAGQSAAILTIQNLGQLDNFDLYINNSAQLAVDMKSSDFQILDATPSVNIWHLIEGRLFYGSTTYQLIVRYDGKLMPTLTSNGTPGSTFVRSLHLGSSGNAQTYVMDRDDTALYVGDSDPGFLDQRAPVLRAYTGSGWL